MLESSGFTPMALAVLVQMIKVEWSKSSRGGQGARNRNSVPSALTIPDDLLGRWRGEILVDSSYWNEANDFARPNRRESERLPPDKVLRIGSVSIALRAEGSDVVRGPETLAIRFIPLSREIFMCRREWARVVFNSRFSCIDSGNWWYEQVIVNAGLFDGRPASSVFVESRPAWEFRRLTRLR